MRAKAYLDCMTSSLLAVAGLIGSCVLACLIGLVIAFRAPFQLVSWLLGCLLEALAALCAWTEDL